MKLCGKNCGIMSESERAGETSVCSLRAARSMKLSEQEEKGKLLYGKIKSIFYEHENKI